MKRQGLALLVVVALVAGTGCIGLVFGDGLDLEAQPATVDDATLSETGFELEGTETVQFNDTVSAAGQERDIRATNYVTTYSQQSSLQGVDQQTGAFVVASTPDFTIAGRSMNPVTDMSNRDLIEEFRGDLESEVGELRNVRQVTERTEPVLGYEGTVTTFAAEADVDGETVTMNVHVTKVRNDGDVVIALGVHPEALQQQAPEVFSMMRAIEHPSEA